MRFAYADPPYPGMSHLYKNHKDYAGEVDHKALIDRLVAEYPDGWALSTNERSLQDLLSLCLKGVRILAWVKTWSHTNFFYPVATWEPVILSGGRKSIKQECYSHLVAPIPIGTNQTFTGRKPESFSFWLFHCLGALPGDQLDDLFPGSGAVSRAWEKYIRQISYLHDGGYERCVSSQSTFLTTTG